MNNVFEIQNQPDFSIIRFFGFVDAATVEHAKPLLGVKLPQGCKRIIVDLEKVEFLDSHGIGFFASLLKKMHANEGKLVFSGAGGQPASVLKMVGFNNSLVTYCDTLASARAMLEKERA